MNKIKVFIAAHTVLTLCLCVSVVLIFRAYQREHDDRVQMTATVKAQQVIIAQAVKDQAAAEQRITARDAALVKTVGALQAVKATTPTSPQETAAQIAQYLQLPSAPAAAPVTTPAAAVSNGQRTTDNGLLFSAPQAEQLRQAAVGCAEDRAKLSGCQQDALDRAAQIKALDAQIQGLTAQRDAAIKAVKGGSFLTRLKREAKDVGIGAGIGFALGYAAHR